MVTFAAHDLCLFLTFADKFEMIKYRNVIHLIYTCLNRYNNIVVRTDFVFSSKSDLHCGVVILATNTMNKMEKTGYVCNR